MLDNERESLAMKAGTMRAHSCLLWHGLDMLHALQRSHSLEGKLGKGRHAEKCSKRFEPEGRACGRHSPVPNFQHLHTSWENKLADCKASNRSKSTIPEVRASVMNPNAEQSMLF